MYSPGRQRSAAARSPRPQAAHRCADRCYLFEQTDRRPGPIKQALMDNTLVVGVGNIYANESLFRAGIHPNRAANRVSLALRAAGAGGESSAGRGHRGRRLHAARLRQRQRRAGLLQLDYFVYGRDGQACKQCGSPLRLMRHGGRATVYCPTCQSERCGGRSRDGAKRNRGTGSVANVCPRFHFVASRLRMGRESIAHRDASASHCSMAAKMSSSSSPTRLAASAARFGSL